MHSEVEAQQLLELLDETLAAGVFVTASGRVVYANQALGRFLGVPVRELVGQSVTTLVPQAAAPALARVLAEAQEGGLAQEHELELKGGEGVTLEVSILAVGAPSRGQVVALVRDLAEQRKIERRLIEAEKLRIFGELASGIAHDFNNLLGAILGRAQALKLKTADGELLHGLDLIERVAAEGAETIRRIQTAARTRAEHDVKAVDIAALAAECLELTRPRWYDQCLSQGVSIHVTSDLAPAALVRGIASELREVILTLILNAIDAMPHGGTLSLVCRSEDYRVVLNLSDTGVGIPREARARIFEPFYSTKGARGNGLGLAVAAAIVQRHRGRLHYLTVEGAGTTFTLDLPAAARPQGDSAAAHTATLPAGASVLVVEDETHIREALAEMLAASGLRVSVAGDGLEGIDRLSRESFDVVLSDLGLPGATGYQVAHAARQCTPPPRVVLMTGWGASLEPADWRAYGIDEVLSKPFRIEDLMATLARLLEAPVTV